MVVDIVRRFVSFWGERKGEEVDLDEIVSRLQVAKVEIDGIKSRLMEEIGRQYDNMLEAANAKDEEALHLAASELVLKRKMLMVVLTYSKLLSLTIQRINDAKNIESIAKALAPLGYVLKAGDEYLAAVSPEIVSSLTSVIELADGIRRRVESTTSYLPSARIAEIDAEARQEIARLIAEAKRESEQLARVPEIYSKPLEERLLEYVREKGGAISISAAAKELGVTPSDVRRALEALEERGVIRVFRKQAEAT
ncbi:MAG: winged helix-turn-helix transcriptional regulator [Acidilobaceae archaeon]|nr:winged helix-turn-helix transcriptional regulator [Acidilobaceae archaeon]